MDFDFDRQAGHQRHTIFVVAPNCMRAGCPQPAGSARHRVIAVMTFNNLMVLRWERRHPGHTPPDARMEPDLFVCPTCAPKVQAADIVDDEHWERFAHWCWSRDNAHCIPSRDSAVVAFSNLDVPNPSTVQRPTLVEAYGKYEGERHDLSR